MIRKWVILGVLALITLMLLWEFTTEALLYDPIDEIQRSAETETVEKVVVISEFSHAWGQDILRKNVFSPDRRGQEPSRRPAVISRPTVPEPPPTPPPPRPNVVLSGIIRDETGDFVALLALNNQKAVPMREGESVEGLKVIEIQERSVTLVWNETDTFTLSLHTAKTITR